MRIGSAASAPVGRLSPELKTSSANVMHFIDRNIMRVLSSSPDAALIAAADTCAAGVERQGFSAQGNMHGRLRCLHEYFRLGAGDDFAIPGLGLVGMGGDVFAWFAHGT